MSSISNTNREILDKSPVHANILLRLRGDYLSLFNESRLSLLERKRTVGSNVSTCHLSRFLERPEIYA